MPTRSRTRHEVKTTAAWRGANYRPRACFRRAKKPKTFVVLAAATFASPCAVRSSSRCMG